MFSNTFSRKGFGNPSVSARCFGISKPNPNRQKRKIKRYNMSKTNHQEKHEVKHEVKHEIKNEVKHEVKHEDVEPSLKLNLIRFRDAGKKKRDPAARLFAKARKMS